MRGRRLRQDANRTMTPSTRLPIALASAAGLLALAPAGALAAPPPRDASPATLRAYATSGQYLADVAAAAAPAESALVARLDEIDAQRAACSAVGRASLRAATPTTPAAYAGTVRLVFKAAPLRAADARVSALGAARRLGRTVRLGVSSASFAGGRATVTLLGSVRLRSGARSVTLRSLRLSARTTGTTLSATVGGKRVTVLSTRARGNTVSSATGRIRVASASASLSRTGARAVRASGLPTGRIAVLSASVRRTASATAAPTTPSTPTPASPTTPSTTTTTTPAVTTTVPAPTPTPPAPTFDPTPAACAQVPKKPAIVLDIDETAMSNYLGRAGQPPFAGDPGGGQAGQFPPSIAGTDVALAPVKRIYDLAVARGATAFFVTARPTALQATTARNLTEQGYGDAPQVTYKADFTADSGIYKRDARRAIEARGFTVVQNLGDQCTDLFGDASGLKVKIPNPFYLSGGTGAPAAGEQDSEVCGRLQ